MSTPEVNKVVLAYSGGLDTSVILAWIKEHYGCEVIAFTADVGQGDSFEGLEAKALASGASKLYVRDLKEEFLTKYAFPTLRAGAVYERKYLLGTSFARPLIASHQVEIARLEGADAVAHGCTGKGNDQVRFELTFQALAPDLKVIAPWRQWDLGGREELLEYAVARGIPVSQSKTNIYSRDQNLWHLSHEGGELEDPWQEPNEAMYQITVSPEEAPDKPVEIVIGFEQGYPVSLDGTPMGPVELVTTLNKIGGEHGVGRIDLVENRLVGMKSHGVYEQPGAAILSTAHKELESITLDRETLHYKDLVAQKYAELVYDGRWFTPLREALDAFVEVTQQPVTGEVRLKLYKGNIIPTGRKSPYSLYHEGFATFGADDVYNQADAKGFINLFGLPMKVAALAKQKREGADGK
ncbi:argininosuccinate synthase [Sphaerobacter thermophilus]|jgi:argininosuccinate synthase|uniref:Argininosuccinate synthase n=1 Tax=Sphaerobacter thermophilus (strain ATCC 49802 / DSM 20745 / KCCM 41009 / NCIMB 13125 / S 6022) TaxID=479434 RepID=D1CA16_SPHTD|nr:argininosuccinate synthase [Sphaerobacter thermophilus]ACZ40659.1 argininosuccinate synthase [Sphaerobacter thermophilus DSM 20745]PZN63245.1 MAG: argininosuccinate synthase [Sphaerobacter thermophilus]